MTRCREGDLAEFVWPSDNIGRRCMIAAPGDDPLETEPHWWVQPLQPLITECCGELSMEPGYALDRLLRPIRDADPGESTATPTAAPRKLDLAEVPHG